jgi:uncharacterized protein YjbI with pentapeptide repeats
MNDQDTLFSPPDAPDFTGPAFFKDAAFTKLQHADEVITGVEFYRCTFTSCSFFRTKFIDCDFENCTFAHCDLSLIVLQSCRLLDVSFEQSKIVGTDWTHLRQPVRFSFAGCKLDGGNFLRMALPGLRLVDSSARDCDFTEAKVVKADFSDTDFEGARFVETDLSFANFTGAHNYAIDPNRVKLKKTIFALPDAVALLNRFDIILK